MRLREEFELFGNVRPVNTIVPGRYENIDLVLIRENLGGFYVAHEFYIPQGNDPHAAAVCTGMNTREGSERIAASRSSTRSGMAARRSPWSTRPTSSRR